MNEQPITLADLLRVLEARKVLLLTIFGSIVGAGMLVTLLMPPTYQSTMKILLTRTRLDPQVSSSDKTNDLLRGEMSEEDFNSELEILQSRSVLEATAKQLEQIEAAEKSAAPTDATASPLGKLGEWYRSFHEQAPATQLEKAVARFSGGLEVVPVKKSRIIQVTYRDSSPERAALVLQTLYQKYADHHLNLHQNEKAAQVFRTQSEEFNRQLKAATDALKRFDVANGLAGSPAQRELLLQQFYQLQQQLNQTRTEQQETVQRIAMLKRQLASTPERIEAEIRTKYTGARDRIKDEILALEMQSAQLRQKYQANHRLVKEVEERLAQARNLLAREEQAPPQERATLPNEIHRRLMTDLLLAQSNLAALNERQQRLATLTKQYQAQVSTLDVKSLERAELERTRIIHEEAFLLYRKKAQEAEISNLMNQARITNISLAQAATVNHKAISPKPALNFAVLSVIGLLAGLATVFVLERDNLARRQPRPTLLPVSYPPTLGLGLALDQLQQRERQLRAENAYALGGREHTRTESFANAKSITWLRHRLRKEG